MGIKDQSFFKDIQGLAIGFIIALCSSVALLTVGLEWVNDDLVSIVQLVTVLLITFSVVFLMIFLFRKYLFKKANLRFNATLRDVTERLYVLSERIFEKDREGIRDNIKGITLDAVSIYSWVAIRAWFVKSIIIIFAIFVGILGTHVIFAQNKLISNQNSIIKTQNKLMCEQNNFLQENLIIQREQWKFQQSQSYLQNIYSNGDECDDQISRQIVQGSVKAYIKISTEPVDLSNAQLCRTRFDGYSWKNLILNSADYEKASLIGSGGFSRISLNSAKFKDSVIKDYTFDIVSFNETDFSESTMTNVIISNAFGKSPSFKFKDKSKNIIIKNSILEDADFSGTTLENVKFENSILRGINFYNATLKNVKFINVDIRGADWSKVKINNIENGNNCVLISSDAPTKVKEQTTLVYSKDEELHECFNDIKGDIFKYQNSILIKDKKHIQTINEVNCANTLLPNVSKKNKKLLNRLLECFNWNEEKA